MTSVKKKQALIYAIIGVLFGILFPLISTIIISWQNYGDISSHFLLKAQRETSLLWVIDSAPFWLGLFAWFAGVRQDRVIKEIERSKIIEEELRERNRIFTEDMEAARKVHAHSLPKIPEFKKMEAAYIYLPLELVGGDILDIIQLDDESVGLFIGDVSGHGVAAALINAFTIALIRRNYKDYGKTPALFLDNLHDELHQLLPDNKFLSCLYTHIIPGKEKSKLIFSRAGHHQPIIWRENRKSLAFPECGGGAISFKRRNKYSQISMSLYPGDCLFLYTDGLLECRDVNNQPLGFEGFIRIISKVCAQEDNIKNIVNRIIREHEILFQGDEDDRLLFGLKIL